LRITNAILHRTGLSGVTRSLEGLEEATRRAVSGKRVERPSDDPVAVTGILRASGGLRAIDQYLRNLAVAGSRLAVEDDVLGQLSELLARGRELGVGQAGDTAGAGSRSIAAAEVRMLVDAARTLGNTRLGDAWVFGGDEAHRPPFDDDPTRALPVGEPLLEVGTGTWVPGAHSARTIFGDTGALDALEVLAQALEGNDREGIAVALTGLDAAFGSVQRLVGEVGARMNRVDVARENLSALELNLRTYRSDLEEVEMEEAISTLIRRQVAYQAALAANARILSLNLTDYLR